MVLLSILGFACMAVLFVDFIETIDVNEKLPQKPLKCVLCAGFWLSVGANIYWYGSMGIVLAPISGILAEVIDRYLNE